MIPLRERDISIAIPLRDPESPYVIRLTHRPSNISAEGSGADYDEAKADAMAKLTGKIRGIEEKEV